MKLRQTHCLGQEEFERGEFVVIELGIITAMTITWLMAAGEAREQLYALHRLGLI